MRRYLFLLIIVFFVLLINAIPYAANECDGGTTNLAFPTAQGYGRCVNDWRGGTIYPIKTTASSGAGSLKECLQAPGNRVCVIETCGWIDLNGGLLVRPDEGAGNNVAVIGQTACNDGIGIYNGYVLHEIRNNIMWRYIHAYMDYTDAGHNPSGHDTLEFNGGTGIIVDHGTFIGGTDQTFSYYAGRGNVTQVTIQNNIFDFPLDCNKVPAPFNCGAAYNFLGGATATQSSYEYVQDVSIYRNIFGHAAGRQPNAIGQWVVFTENIIYNWSSSENTDPTWRVSHDGCRGLDNDVYCNIKAVDFQNYLRPGPLTPVGNRTNSIGQYDISTSPFAAHGTHWMGGNWHSHRCGGVCNPATDILSTSRCGSDFTCTSPPTARPDDEPTTDTAASAVAACDIMVADGGAGNSRRIDANGAWVNRRTVVDEAIVGYISPCNTTALTGGLSSLATRLSDIPGGGRPTLATGISFTDADNDGMSDTWEALECPGGDCSPWSDDALLRCPNSANNGWSNAEEFWNGTCPYNKRKKTGFILQ